MSTRIRYIAEPTHVQEVSLRGTADLGFWQSQLADEDLVPVEHGGKAQILIVAATMRYMAMRFTEVSFSVLLSGGDKQPTGGGAFLVQAFSSSRPFAFIERALFAAPYSHAVCRVSVAPPSSIQIARGGKTIFRAEMSQIPNAPEKPDHIEEDGWEGPVFLPRNGNPRREGCMFFVRIRGRARTCPFMRTDDTLFLAPSPAPGVFQTLLDSQFAATEWVVREDATHGKSKTYRRSEGLRDRRTSA